MLNIQAGPRLCTASSAYSRGGHLAAREPFLSGPYYILKLLHTILKYIIYNLIYRYNNCYIVLNIIKYLNNICIYKYSVQP
jgi:hypothetical protein